MELRGDNLVYGTMGFSVQQKVFCSRLNSITVYFNNWTLDIFPEHPALPIVRLPGPIKILNFESIPQSDFISLRRQTIVYHPKFRMKMGNYENYFSKYEPTQTSNPGAAAFVVVVVSAAFVLFIQAFLFSTPGDSRWQRLKNLNERKICFGMKNKPQELFSRVPLGVYTSRCLWRFEVLCAHTSVARGMTTLAIFFRQR